MEVMSMQIDPNTGEKLFEQSDLDVLFRDHRRNLQQQVKDLGTERGQLLSEVDEITDRLTALGFAPNEGESLVDAASRFITHAEGKLAEPIEIVDPGSTDEHQAVIANLKATRDHYRAQLDELRINDALLKVAREMRAFNPEQIRDILRPYVKTMGREIVVRGFEPNVMQSIREAVAMIHDSPEFSNLFIPNGRR
jgi:hypothetical protein